MPKIVDHEKRKEQIAEAAWRVIRREGLDGVSVRRIAEEMGISLGSLRHYFDSQDELLSYAMRLISKRVRLRIQSLPLSGDALSDIELILAEMAPLDEERLAESEVWLAFAGKAVSDPSVRELSLEVHEELALAIRRLIEVLVDRKAARDGINVELEARRLHALLDGLVVHHTTFSERLDRKELMETISYHLKSLLVGAP